MRQALKTQRTNFSDYLEPYGLVAPGTILTYSGSLLIGFECQGIDPDECSTAERTRMVERVAKRIKQLPTGVLLHWRYHQEVVHCEWQVRAGSLSVVDQKAAAFWGEQEFLEKRIDLFVEVPLVAAKAFGVRLNDMVERVRKDGFASLSKSWSKKETRVDGFRRGLKSLAGIRSKIEKAFQAVHPAVMDDNTIVSRIQACVNFDRRCRHHAYLPWRLDHWLNRAYYQIHRGMIQVDEWFVGTVTVKSLDQATHAHQLATLSDLPYALSYSVHYCGRDNREVESTFIKHQRGFTNSGIKFNQNQAPKNLSGPNGEGASHEDIKNEVGGRVGAALREMQNGTQFGRMAVTVIVRGRTPDELRARLNDVEEALQVARTIPMREKLGNFWGWIGSIPGGVRRHCIREIWASAHNALDLAPLFKVQNGNAYNEFYRGPATTWMVTRDAQNYGFNLNVGDILHWAMLGKTGSGKSYLCKHLVLSVMRYGGWMFLHTMGDDYDLLVRLMGGQVTHFDLTGRNPLNLYTLEEKLSPQYRNMLLEVWAHLADFIQFELTGPLRAELSQKLEVLFEQPAEERRQFNLLMLVSHDLRDLIRPFCRGEAYGALFDGKANQGIGVQNVNLYNYSQLGKMPGMTKAVITFTAYIQDQVVEAPAMRKDFKYIWFDEIAQLLTGPEDPLTAKICAYGHTGRKNRTALAVIAQTLEQLTHAGLFDDLRTTCASWLFLPNSGIKVDRFHQAFDGFLNHEQVQAIVDMEPKRELLFRNTAGSAKILRPVIDPWTGTLIESDAHWRSRLDYWEQEVGFPACVDHVLTERENEKAKAKGSD